MLSHQESEGTREEANDDRADETDINLIDPNGHADENGNAETASVNSAQQQVPSPATLRRMPMMIKVADPATSVARVTPSTTTTTQVCIPENRKMTGVQICGRSP